MFSTSTNNINNKLAFNAQFYLDKTDIPILQGIYNNILIIDPTADFSISSHVKFNYEFDTALFSNLLDKKDNKILLTVDDFYNFAILICKGRHPLAQVRCFLGGPPENYNEPILSQTQLETKERVEKDAKQLSEKILGIEYSAALQNLWLKKRFTILAVQSIVSVKSDFAVSAGEALHCLASSERSWDEEESASFVDFNEYQIFQEHFYLGERNLGILLNKLVMLRDDEISTPETRLQLTQRYGFLRSGFGREYAISTSDINEFVLHVRNRLEWLQLCILIMFHNNNSSLQAKENFFRLSPIILSYFGVSHNVAAEVYPLKNRTFLRYFSENFLKSIEDENIAEFKNDNDSKISSKLF